MHHANGNTKKKILFAAVPADGHFNPLIRLAKHLQIQGYDVRWYAASKYECKLKQLQIPMYRFSKEIDVTISDAETAFPERKKIKGAIKRIIFDLENFFIKRGPLYFRDIREIYSEFPFDLFVADITFTGSIFVKELLHIPVISIGVLPLIESSKDLAPSGLGMEPASGRLGKIKQSLLRFFVKNIMLRKTNKFLHRQLESYGIQHDNIFLFDLIVRKSDYVLQSGTQGFEYKRSDLGSNIRFIGALTNNIKVKNKKTWFDDRLLDHEFIVLVTQGTIEKDANKIIVPTIEAFKDSGALVICTTGGCQTEEWKTRFDHRNIIIEDFIDFNDVMPYTDVYITNGGYGGVILGIENGIPMIVAGVHEGKNEICSRVGYFKYGIDLKTETPTAPQIRSAVREVIGNPVYKKNIEALRAELNQYNPDELFEKYVAELTRARIIRKAKQAIENMYY